MSIKNKLYHFPDFKLPKVFKSSNVWFLVLIILISSSFGFLGGFFSEKYFSPFNLPALEQERIIQKEIVKENIVQTTEQKIIQAVQNTSPAVVSIVVSKDVQIIEISPFGNGFFSIPQYQQKGVEKQEIAGGTGFIVSSNGLVLTNKHVVLDENADYTVLTNKGEKFPAQILARHPVQDLAILKIQSNVPFPAVKLGDSSKLQIGQTVVAIGNSLGEFRNTVSVGVVSGLGRTITAGGEGLVETIEDVIQTDAAINKGNSGGPLLNLEGEVVGINTATVLSAQNISFTVPINKAKKAIEQVKSLGKITYPFLGIRYISITEEVKEKYSLSVDYGILLIEGENKEPAVTPDSGAAEAGLQKGDVILEFNGRKLTIDNTLSELIQDYIPGDVVVLKYLRDGKERIVQVVLKERKD